MPFSKKTKPGDSVKQVAKIVDELIDYINAALNVTVGPGLEARRIAGGIHISLSQQSAEAAAGAGDTEVVVDVIYDKTSHELRKKTKRLRAKAGAETETVVTVAEEDVYPE